MIYLCSECKPDGSCEELTIGILEPHTCDLCNKPVSARRAYRLSDLKNYWLAYRPQPEPGLTLEDCRKCGQFRNHGHVCESEATPLEVVDEFQRLAPNAYEDFPGDAQPRRDSYCGFCEPLPSADATEDPLEGVPMKLCEYHEQKKRAVDKALGIE